MREIYEQFENAGVVKNQGEWSSVWLNQCSSYHSSITSQKRQYSTSVLLTLWKKIQLELQGDLEAENRVMLSEAESQLRKKIFN